MHIIESSTNEIKLLFCLLLLKLHILLRKMIE